MKLSLYMADDLVKQVDAAADALHITRTAFISMAVSQKLQSDAFISQLPDFIALVKAQSEKIERLQADEK